MTERTVDARGQVCPKPLIMTKKALADLTAGQTMTVLIDNPTSRDNVERFLADNRVVFRTHEREGVFNIHVTAMTGPLANPDAESYCAPEVRRPHAVCIKNDRMGFGDEQLGAILIRAFVNTIADVKPLPGAIVFYNAGVRLTLDDSPVLDALKELEAADVQILVCGTCVDFYKVKDRVRVGTVSNMYTISEALIRASSVIYP